MKTIPIVINNRDRLTTTKYLADGLHNLGYTNIHILDNNSSYGPLLEWYNSCNYIVNKLGSNMGQLAIYNSDYINKFSGWIAYTDSDIIPNHKTPDDFIQRMIEVGERYNYTKVGLALRIDDLPGTVYADFIREWESKYWVEEIEPTVCVANVDTTFHITKVGLPFDYKALRIAGDFTASHWPWYLNYDNLSPEEQYIIDNSDQEFSTTKRHYIKNNKTK